jgi:hypothetical protein
MRYPLWDLKSIEISTNDMGLWGINGNIIWNPYNKLYKN